MGERSVRIGGDAKGNAIATGDRNVVTVTYSASLPPAESVDIRAALAALQQALAGLDPPDKGKMDRALTDAAEEAAKADPDRDEIGGAIERAGGSTAMPGSSATRLPPSCARTTATSWPPRPLATRRRPS